MSIVEAYERTLTDDEITALIADPAKIETHEIALEVLGVLDAEIADIQTQLDAYAMEANVRPLSGDRQAWARRASYAGAMRRNERHRVYQRDKEIRGTKGSANMQPKHSKEEKALKQQRLLTEAEDRRLKRSLAIEQQKTRQMELAKDKRDRPLLKEIERLQAALRRAEEIIRADHPNGETVGIIRAALTQPTQDGAA